MKHVDLGEPTSFLDHVYLESTQRECKPNEGMVDEYSNMFQPRVSARATAKLPESEKNGANVASWSYDVEGHAKKCV